MSKAPYNIWWTSDLLADQLKLSDFPPIPEYVREQFRSRRGRCGRGRLWVPDGIPVKSIPEDQVPGQCAGIVFHPADLRAVGKLPGFITEITEYE